MPTPSRRALRRLIPLAIGFALITGGIYFLSGQPSQPVNGDRKVRVLAYSSFVNSWGAGPEIARLFKAQTGLEVELLDGGESTLLLKKLEVFPADAVVGLDQITLYAARAKGGWRKLQPLPDEPAGLMNREPEFLPVDWAPIAFVYRNGEIDPPNSLDDLLHPRFTGAIALPDPRQSSLGLQFFLAVLDAKGIDDGFRFFEKLKPNLHLVAPSWSASYGVFTRGQAKLALSFMTSPVYHQINEKNDSYRAAILAGESSFHPYQIEYVAVPASCENCAGGELFARFMIKADAQRLLMEKNIMLPNLSEVSRGTPFAQVPVVDPHLWKNLPELLQRREELFERWRSLGL